MSMNYLRGAALGVLAALSLAGAAFGEDWPQLQRDSARTGRTTDTVKAPFRARWVWMGPEWTIRNKDSKPGGPDWKDDLASGDGKDYRMPKSLPMSFANSMQPVIAAGRVFIADAQGKVYAVNGDDGSTLWTADNPGGSLWPGVATDKVVVFGSLWGYVTGYDAATGRQLWQVDTGRTITGAPALTDGVVYVGNHGGMVYAMGLEDGKVAWKSDRLSGPIHGGLCVANGKVYMGTDAMEAVALDARSGKVVASNKVTGQSFRMVWPVAVKDRVIFTSVSVICPGSEYVNDPILSAGAVTGFKADAKPGYPSAAAEDEAKRKWLSTAPGKYWEIHFALKADTLEKDYIIATGATEGCGTSPNPPAIDVSDRPLLWYATAYPTFAKKGTFGSSYSMDISSFDLASGKRIPIDNGRMGVGTTETDNLFAMTIGGDILYLRQNFRGTQWINLKTSEGGWISAQYRWRDGGNWPAPINYANGSRTSDASTDIVRTPSVPAAGAGRAGPAIADNKLYFTEDFGLTCAETAK